jgi:hypothetical protein
VRLDGFVWLCLSRLLFWPRGNPNFAYQKRYAKFGFRTPTKSQY